MIWIWLSEFMMWLSEYNFSMWMVLYLGLLTLVPTFAYYFIITSIFEIKHKRFKWVSTLIFFVLYGFVRSYIFYSMFFSLTYRPNTFLSFVSNIINSFSAAAHWMLIFLIIRGLFVITKKGLEKMRLRKQNL